MDAPAQLPRSRRRASLTAPYPEMSESDLGQDSGFGYEEAELNLYDENIGVLSSSPGSEESFSTNLFRINQTLDDSNSGRKRVSHACDFCRRKKCRVSS
jgi:hypothetical protein